MTPNLYPALNANSRRFCEPGVPSDGHCVRKTRVETVFVEQLEKFLKQKFFRSTKICDVFDGVRMTPETGLE